MWTNTSNNHMQINNFDKNIQCQIPAKLKLDLNERMSVLSCFLLVKFLLLFLLLLFYT